MKKILIFIACISFIVYAMPQLQAQSATLARANKYYNTLNYSKAIPLYEWIVKKQEADASVLVKLANCYRLTNNIDKAVKMYEQVANMQGSEPINKLYYAQALLSKGEYSKASLYLNQYSEDKRGQILAKSAVDIQRYYKDTANYKIKKVPFNSPKNDFSPIILEDERVAFVSSRPRARLINYTHGWTGYPFTNLYVTEKNKKGEYKKPRLFSKKIKSHLNDGPMCFAPDMKTIYFTRNSAHNGKTVRGDAGQVNLHICQATYYKDKKSISNVAEFIHNNKNYKFAHPAISQDGNYLYFSSDRPGGYGGMDLWMCTRQGDKWGEPVNLGERINSAGNEVFPYVHGTDKLYYSSNGLGGLGGLDVFEATLNTSNGKPTGKSYNMGAYFNSPADDFGVVFRADGRSGYLSSNRAKVDADDDIYEFTITAPIYRSIIIKGTAYDKKTNLPIAGATITLSSEDGQILEQVASDAQGKYQFEGEFDLIYNLEGEKGKYNPAHNSVTTKNAQGKQEIISDLYLELIPPIELAFTVVDQKTQIPIEGVNIKMVDRKTGIEEEFVTNSSGMFVKPLSNVVGDMLIYDFKLSHKEYLPKDRAFSYTITEAGTINVKDQMFKIEIGQDVGKALNLNPIYFDYNKFNIRPDAKVELDKIVKIMNQYPTMVIELGSHTDCRGTAKYNLNLSDKRAKASAAYIVSTGISKNRIYGKGYGESKLVNKCECEGKRVTPCTEEEHQMNRRTEFIIVKY